MATTCATLSGRTWRGILQLFALVFGVLSCDSAASGQDAVFPTAVRYANVVEAMRLVAPDTVLPWDRIDSAYLRYLERSDELRRQFVTPQLFGPEAHAPDGDLVEDTRQFFARRRSAMDRVALAEREFAAEIGGLMPATVHVEPGVFEGLFVHLPQLVRLRAEEMMPLAAMVRYELPTADRAHLCAELTPLLRRMIELDARRWDAVAARTVAIRIYQRDHPADPEGGDHEAWSQGYARAANRDAQTELRLETWSVPEAALARVAEKVSPAGRWILQCAWGSIYQGMHTTSDAQLTKVLRLFRTSNADAGARAEATRVILEAIEQDGVDFRAARKLARERDELWETMDFGATDTSRAAREQRYVAMEAAAMKINERLDDLGLARAARFERLHVTVRALLEVTEEPPEGDPDALSGVPAELAAFRLLRSPLRHLEIRERGEEPERWTAPVMDDALFARMAQQLPLDEATRGRAAVAIEALRTAAIAANSGAHAIRRGAGSFDRARAAAIRDHLDDTRPAFVALWQAVEDALLAGATDAEQREATATWLVAAQLGDPESNVLSRLHAPFGDSSRVADRHGNLALAVIDAELPAEPYRAACAVIARHSDAMIAAARRYEVDEIEASLLADGWCPDGESDASATGERQALRETALENAVQTLDAAAVARAAAMQRVADDLRSTLDAASSERIERVHRWAASPGVIDYRTQAAQLMDSLIARAADAPEPLRLTLDAMRAAAIADIDRAHDAIARLVWSPPPDGWRNDATTGSFDDIELNWLNFRRDQTTTAWGARMGRVE